MRAGIIGALDFQDRTKMGEEWWSSVLKGGCVWVTHTSNTSFHKYTRVARGQYGVEVKSLIDLVLVEKDMLRFLHDVRAVGGIGGLGGSEVRN